ncbi:MAG TPA: hypothetical protein VEQ63_06145 [Bryobacteraceae bacterium]|nr:hypothetical protein [Bryobacteraceae bacterium]
MNSNSDAIELSGTGTQWPLAAYCAFFAAVMELLWLGFYLSYWDGVRESMRNATPPPSSLQLWLAIPVLALPAQFAALWAVGLRRQHLAPVAARVGMWAPAAYILFGLLAMAAGAFRAEVGTNIFILPNVALAVSFACLGWASRGASEKWQSLASAGLILVAVSITVFLALRLSGLGPENPAPWRGTLRSLLQFAMWVAVGLWLRRP